MKYVVIILFLFPFGLFGQNLVPNGSFEDTISCPSTLGMIHKSIYWSSPSDGSPDFFHTCSNGWSGLPNNVFGYQMAFNGIGYAGIAVYDLYDNYSYREYLQVQLTQPLESGQKYWVCFHVSLADSVEYAIKEVAAFFSETAFNLPHDTMINVNPQIQFNDSVITEKNGWVKVKGEFTANGNEKYMIIGNFNRKQTTTAIKVYNSFNNSFYSYYYIDDVYVSADSLICTNNINPLKKFDKNLINIYPTTTNEFFIIENYNSDLYDLFIYDTMGKLVYEENSINLIMKEIETRLFPKGLLLIKIKSKNKTYNFKILNV
jgi:hypothetical protein